jgi:hypothetical protein
MVATMAAPDPSLHSPAKVSFSKAYHLIDKPIHFQRILAADRD